MHPVIVLNSYLDTSLFKIQDPPPLFGNGRSKCDRAYEFHGLHSDGLIQWSITCYLDKEINERESPTHGGATHSLGVGTNCKTTAPHFGKRHLLDFQSPNLQPPLFIEAQAQPLQINNHQTISYFFPTKVYF